MRTGLRRKIWCGWLCCPATISAIADGHGRTLVEASWAQAGQPSSDSVEVETYDAARAIAHTIANQLAAGTPPDLSRD